MPSLAKSGSAHSVKRLSVRLSTCRCAIFHTSAGMRVNQLLVRSLHERRMRGKQQGPS